MINCKEFHHRPFKCSAKPGCIYIPSIEQCRSKPSLKLKPNETQNELNARNLERWKSLKREKYLTDPYYKREASKKIQSFVHQRLLDNNDTPCYINLNFSYGTTNKNYIIYGLVKTSTIIFINKIVNKILGTNGIIYKLISNSEVLELYENRYAKRLRDYQVIETTILVELDRPLSVYAWNNSTFYQNISWRLNSPFISRINGIRFLSYYGRLYIDGEKKYAENISNLFEDRNILLLGETHRHNDSCRDCIKSDIDDIFNDCTNINNYIEYLTKTRKCIDFFFEQGYDLGNESLSKLFSEEVFDISYKDLNKPIKSLSNNIKDPCNKYKILENADYLDRNNCNQVQTLNSSKNYWECKFMYNKQSYVRVHRIDARYWIYNNEKVRTPCWIFPNGFIGQIYIRRPKYIESIRESIKYLREKTHYRLDILLDLFLNFLIKPNELDNSKIKVIMKMFEKLNSSSSVYITKLSYKLLEFFKKKIIKRYMNTILSRKLKMSFTGFLIQFKRIYIETRLNNETGKQDFKDKYQNEDYIISDISEKELLNMAYHIDSFVCSLMLDITLILRIFKIFSNEPGKSNRIIGCEYYNGYRYPKNIIIYGGTNHIKVCNEFIRQVFKMEPKYQKESLKSKGDNTKCLHLDSPTQFFPL